MTDDKQFRYRSFEIAEIMKKPKRCHKPPVVTRNGDGLRCECVVYLIDPELIMIMCVCMTAGRKDVPTSYKAVFLLDNERVRGVDYNPMARKRWYRETIPAGWHENVVDPNLPGDDRNQNRHNALLDFQVTDFDDFVHKVCALWYIDTGMERRLL